MANAHRMTTTGEAWADTFSRLLRSASPTEQLRLRQPLKGDQDYFVAIAAAYLDNPFFQLTDDEAAVLAEKVRPEGIAHLIAARHEAMNVASPKYVVFCMPKSGSSFVQSALEHALELPKVSLTSFGNTELSSHFGMNPREQELDALALVKAAIMHRATGFVAQHHTRYTEYLARQIQAYRMTPIVTIRNILDAIVSFDDMMLAWRAGKDPEAAWMGDSPFALPLDYPQLAPEARCRLLAHSLGVWLIQFHLSWLRCRRQGYVSPVVIRYETEVLDPPRFVGTLTGALGLTESQAARLRAYAEHPDRNRSRLNVGRAGRGRERVPDDARAFLLDYAQMFAAEIPQDDIRDLLS
jgi:hypothetical protein